MRLGVVAGHGQGALRHGQRRHSAGPERLSVERARGRHSLVAAAAANERLGEVRADHRMGRRVGDAALALDRESQSEVLGGSVGRPGCEGVMAAAGVHAHQLVGQLQPFRELELIGERLVVEATLRCRDPGEDAEPPALVVRTPELPRKAYSALAVGLRTPPTLRLSAAATRG